MTAMLRPRHAHMEKTNRLGENLIFMISQPRSGSTLLQRVLGGHPLIHTTAETWIMLNPLFALRRQGMASLYDSQLAQIALAEFLQHYAGGVETYYQAVRKMASVLYGEALRISGKPYFLDKTPRYYFIINELYRIFPNATYILLFRNPLAVLSSILHTWVIGKQGWPYLSYYRYDLLHAPRQLLLGQDAIKDPITVRYEDFIKNPHEIIGGICQRIGIPFTPEIIEYGKFPALQGFLQDPVGTYNHTAPTAASLEKWRTLADTPQTKHVAQAYLAALGPEVLGRMGYSFEELSAALGSQSLPEDEVILPWNILIKPSQEWTPEERQFMREHYHEKKQA